MYIPTKDAVEDGDNHLEGRACTVLVVKKTVGNRSKSSQRYLKIKNQI